MHNLVHPFSDEALPNARPLESAALCSQGRLHSINPEHTNTYHLWRVEKHTVCWLAISTCTATLLVVRLERLCDRMMDHEADIGFVHPEAKCSSCNDDLDFVVRPCVLRCREDWAFRS
jgi:hypothetical protein